VASVYIETTIPSYLTARPSRDLVTAAHQQITHDWWDNDRKQFDLFISEFVLDEIRAGDSQYAAKRMELLTGVRALRFSADVEQLGLEYERRLGLAGAGTSDLPHFAYAVAYNMDYLLTWNCAHIANGQIIKRLIQVNDELGRLTPIILTPQELMANFPLEDDL
jgi:hypothetical protein